MGPSGSGKTTLLNLLGGTDKANKGEIEFNGKRIDNLNEGQLTAWRAANVGFIFQFYNLMPILTAAQNVELPLLLTKLSPAKRRENVNTALKIVGLEDRAKHRPREMSGGQQQRVAIARAIVTQPAVLLADEPTGNLDTQRGAEIMRLLWRLNTEQNITVVMVTHEADMAAYARRIVRFVDGVVASDQRNARPAGLDALPHVLEPAAEAGAA